MSSYKLKNDFVIIILGHIGTICALVVKDNIDNIITY